MTAHLIKYGIPLNYPRVFTNMFEDTVSGNQMSSVSDDSYMVVVEFSTMVWISKDSNLGYVTPDYLRIS